MAIAEQELQQESKQTLVVGRDTLEGFVNIVHATSKDASRQILTGVCFRADHVYATDSYILVKRPLPEGCTTGGLTVILDGKALAAAAKSALKACAYGSPMAEIHLEEGKAHMSHMGGTVILPVIEGDFPQCEQLFPSYSGDQGPATIGLNPFNLARVFKAMGIGPKKASTGVSGTAKLTMADALKPILVTPTDEENPARGLVMPVRLP